MKVRPLSYKSAVQFYSKMPSDKNEKSTENLSKMMPPSESHVIIYQVQPKLTTSESASVRTKLCWTDLCNLDHLETSAHLRTI